MENNVEVTAKAIDMMAEKMIYGSERLKEAAANLRSSSDFTWAGDAMNIVINCLVNMRLDILVTKSVKDDWFDNLKG